MIWFDLDNSPHVPLFKPILGEFDKKGIEYIITARDFAQTKELLELNGLKYRLIGNFIGKNKTGKVTSTVLRAGKLYKFIRDKKISLAFSHGVRSQSIASRMAGIRSISMTDYEYSEKHIVNIFSNFILIPKIIPESRLKDAGINLKKVIRYNGFKEEIYLADFVPLDGIRHSLNITDENVLIVIRPPSLLSSYHDSQSEFYLKTAVQYFAEFDDARCIIVNRSEAEKNYIESIIPAKHNYKFMFLRKPVDGLQLLYAADIAISGGGTMNRESALLGTETYSIFTGKTPYIDEYLEKEKRLKIIREPSEITSIKVTRKPKRNMVNFSRAVRDEIVNLILSYAGHYL
jgi:predicted glycosyltransferase